MDDQLHLLTGAYALNALDDEERRRFEHTLGFGDETAEEARELAETAALLAAGTTPVAPPPDLKARLMAQIALTPQLDAVHPTCPRAPAAAQPAEDPAAESTPPTPLHGRSRLRGLSASSRWMAAAAAVLLAAAGGTGLWGFQQQHERDAALSALAAAQGAPSATMGRILAADDAKVQEVAAPGGATVLIAQSKDAGLAGVITIGMPAPPAGKSYELWLIDTAGKASPAGLVPAGNGTTWNELPGGVGTARYLGMTVEPAKGSPEPTTQPILLQTIA
jgi:anti-sigma-K factor RskA